MPAKSRPELYCPITGWGVSARLASSRADLLQSALLGLAAGFKVSPRSSAGAVFRVRAADSNLELTEADRVIFLGRSKHGLRIAVEHAIETLASTQSPHFAFLHAGCIEIVGKAILFPGRSHAGKSTLVAEFLKRGASYFSDDLVPIDKKLRAHPFPRPISLRSMTSGAARRTSIKSLGAKPAAKALPIAMVI